jgi:tetratricopeptide (TPR) repeat protein
VNNNNNNNNNNLKALYLRGSAFSKKGQFANAIRDLTAAIEIDPNHIESLYDRGLLLLL